MTGRRRFGVLPGDPAGIGYEIAVKALREYDEAGALPAAFVVYAHAGLFELARARYAPKMQIARARTPGEIDGTGIYYIDVGYGDDDIAPGVVSAQAARCAHRAIERCTLDVTNGDIDGICTGPIHKGAMRLANIGEIGHTEMLAHAFDAPNPITLFLTNDLRIFFYTRHLSLRQAIDALDVEQLVAFGETINVHMRQLGFTSPHLALAALNPHASDGGQFGDEEERILVPAANRLRRLGIDISDPIGADSVFYLASRGKYDAVVSLYHDQGHIAAKTYDFDRTISATLGLPVLRTSVDHGTAMDIAWRGMAQHVSMKTALDALLRYCF